MFLCCLRYHPAQWRHIGAMASQAVGKLILCSALCSGLTPRKNTEAVWKLAWSARFRSGRGKLGVGPICCGADFAPLRLRSATAYVWTHVIMGVTLSCIFQHGGRPKRWVNKARVAKQRTLIVISYIPGVYGGKMHPVVLGDPAG